ncbi:hypothetical protein TKK_0006714 [Trichogramma kaykai]
MIVINNETTFISSQLSAPIRIKDRKEKKRQKIWNLKLESLTATRLTYSQPLSFCWPDIWPIWQQSMRWPVDCTIIT